MANNYFSFKQFTVRQDQCAMKVGTDGVLLGLLAEVPTKSARVLDVGTGTGLVALIVAQRSANATIDAIEIDENAARQASQNFAASPFSGRLTALHSDAKAFESVARYDLILCNPPYYVNALRCDDKQRNLARHDVAFSFADMAKVFARNLDNQGVATVIIPIEQFEDVRRACSAEELYLISRVDIFPTPHKPIKRVVASFSFHRRAEVKTRQLVLENSPRQYTSDFQVLTADFYLDKR